MPRRNENQKLREGPLLDFVDRELTLCKLLLYDIDDKPYNSVKTFTKYKLMENSQIVLVVNLVLNREIIFCQFL